MITNDAELHLVQEQVQRLERAVESLRREIWPRSPERFRLMAEHYVDSIRELRTEVDGACGSGSTCYNGCRSAATGSNRVNRGGSWNNNPQNCRSANRNNNTPGNRNNNLGFRVALAQPTVVATATAEPAAVLSRWSPRPPGKIHRNRSALVARQQPVSECPERFFFWGLPL